MAINDRTIAKVTIGAGVALLSLAAIAALMKSKGGAALSASIAVSTTGDLAYIYTPTVSGGTAPYAYAWDFGDGATSTEKNPTHTYEDTDTYTVKLTVTDSKGLIASTTKTLTASEDGGSVSDDLKISFNADVSQGLTVVFYPTVSGGTAPYAYAWDFGITNLTDDISTAEIPEYTYPAKGTYSVVLTVSDSSGSAATITQQIQVFEDAIISIPGAGYSSQIIYQQGVKYRDNVFSYGGIEYHTFFPVYDYVDENGQRWSSTGMYSGMPVSAQTGVPINYPYDIGTAHDCLVRSAQGALNSVYRVIAPQPLPKIQQKCKFVVPGSCGVILTASDGKTWEVDLGPEKNLWESILGPIRTSAQAYEDSLHQDWDNTIQLVVKRDVVVDPDIVLLSKNKAGQPELWGWHADGKLYYNGQVKAWWGLNADQTELVFNEV